MSEKTLDELRQEAKELGIEFAKNAGAVRLQEKIDDFYAKESEDADIPEIADEAPEVEEKEVVKASPGARKPKAKVLNDPKAVIAEQIRMGKVTKVVKITMVDKREASTATDAYFSNGDVGMRVPLDTFVEMPKILVDMAEKAKALIHVNGVNGMQSKYTKKYVIEYKDK